MVLRSRALRAHKELRYTFRRQNYFKENIEAIWINSFNIRVKIERQENLSERLTNQFS